MQSRLRPVAVALAALLSLSLVACGSNEEPQAAEKKPDSQPTQGGAKLAALWPLTGLPVESGTPKHAVMVAKIDNSSSSQPQIGLGKADLVTEELVEGGTTRLAVFYYSKMPRTVGPVRSMRATDIGIVKPAKAALVASGAAPPTLDRLRQEKITFFEGGNGYYREGSRRAPYNLMVNLPDVAKQTRKKAVVPASYLPWGAESDFVGAQPARTITARFSPSHTTRWEFRGGKYVNVNSYAAQGDRFEPSTVIALRVQVKDAGYRDPAGSFVPESVFHGKGNMLMFHQGQVVRGTWSKPKAGSQLKLNTAAGAVKVPAGRVWLELVPAQDAGGDVTFAK